MTFLNHALEAVNKAVELSNSNIFDLKDRLAYEPGWI